MEESKSDLLRPPETRENRGNWLGILLVLAVGMVVYLVLSFLTLNFFGPVLVVGGILMMIVAFHYVVWGWWLGRVIRQAEGDEDEA